MRQSKKLKLPETETIMEKREPHRHHPKTTQADLYTTRMEVTNHQKAVGQEPAPTMILKHVHYVLTREKIMGERTT